MFHLQSGGAMLDFGLNQVTMPNATFDEFLCVAKELGCIGVELRNDLGRPFFDGIGPQEAYSCAKDHGLRILGLSQVYPCNRWTENTATEVRALIEIAEAVGAETISLIPCNDGSGTDEKSRSQDLQTALENCLPFLQDANQVALVEPLGFTRSSLRLKSELVQAVDALGAQDHIKLVHDTFHHALAGEDQLFPKQTGIVHISGVEANIPYDHMQDEHRILVGGGDRLNNITQIQALLDAGYTGAFSFECFAPEVQGLARPARAIRQSIDFISSQLKQKAA
ncbi:TIM barrel protein [Actibacterium pelagium]|uniref:Sugar epimerase n=1 Tax=Actibacterium pelagium TaxID=2029103 RepID=A0A917ACI4_9RHOB|nr:TIM barrel protein [Actibacterium pelagium]GGE42701.1 sugar epimerase [Actibacterium pelagium]